MVALFTDTERHAAAAWPTKAERNVFEIPLVAALLIVNDQVSVLQADFVEVLSVEAGQAQAVEPIKTGKQSARRITAIRRCRGRGGLSGRRRRRSRTRRRFGRRPVLRWRGAGLPFRVPPGGGRGDI